MEIKIDIDKLKEKRLMVATPMYGNMASGTYVRSLMQLMIACTKYGIDCKFYSISNESLVQRARNYCVDEFLRSNATHLLFIDADIGFDFRDIFTMLQLNNSADDYGVIAGAYPKKAISWEKVKVAVEKGFATNPNDLQHFVADMVFNVDSHVKQFKLDEPVKVTETGTGFLMIHREVFDKYKAAHPEKSYIPDHIRTENFDGSKEILAYFDCIIDPVSKRYLSEDYMFCHTVRALGVNVWLCPWMKLLHEGSYTFIGNMMALAAIEASPTATKESNPKHYKKGRK